jgi:transcriptional regulator with XRE-family HTH domain
MDMFESTESIRAQLWEKMRGKPYRDSFVAAHLSTNIAAQIQTLREKRGWSQGELAEKAGMARSRISVMENPSYEKFTLSTLKRIASAFDVALITRFAPFSELVTWVSDLSPEKLEIASFDADSIESPVRIKPAPPSPRAMALGEDEKNMSPYEASGSQAPSAALAQASRTRSGIERQRQSWPSNQLVAQ